MGRFIVIYGSNNLGKSMQLDLLEQMYRELGMLYVRIKYPIYDSPTGEVINRVLRPDENGQKLEMDDPELQMYYANNRRWFEPTLIELLKEGDVIAEDYTGTGMAWGLVKGVDRGYLDEINDGLRKPDFEILLDGERFSGGIEKGHRHEAAGNEIWERSRRIHQELATELGWEIVNANRSERVVHEEILQILVGK